MPEVIAEPTVDQILVGYNTFQIRYAVGDGTYIAVDVTPDVEANGMLSVMFADFNGDGFIDPLIQGQSDFELYLGQSDGAGGFTFDEPAILTDFPASALTQADFDGDGDIDIIAGFSTFAPDPLLFLENDGTGVFTRTTLDPGAPDGVYDLSHGDMDGDGDLDLLVSNFDDLTVLLNDGAGGFTSTGDPGLAGVQIPGGSDLADFDGDGDLDAAVAAVGGVAVLSGIGDGTFTSDGLLETRDANSMDVVAADFDGDGDVDLLSADDVFDFVSGMDVEDTVTFWANDGSGGFVGSSLTLDEDFQGATISTGDIDGDGDIDAIVSSSQDGDAVLINDGAGDFTRTPLADVTENLIYVLAQQANAAIQGGADADVLNGQAWADLIIGGGGDDVLNGMGGYDELRGGDGDDTYVLDSKGDVVVELAGEGVDTVQTDLNLLLLADLENATLLGSANRNVTGNAANNVLTGNEGKNVLDGAAGADTLQGGVGDDTYYIDNAGDLMVEAADEGIDRAYSSNNLILTPNVENGFLTGTANKNLTGNAGDNRLHGNDGRNVITGGAGADLLKGGLGIDTFDFNGRAESSFNAYDLITDLEDQDRIDLSTLDADSTTAGNQSFVLVDGFGGNAGEVRVVYSSASGDTYVQADVDGDSLADFRIRLTGDHRDFDNFVL